MGWISLDFKCPDCNETWDDIVGTDEKDNKFKCPYCLSDNASRTFSAPNFTRASYVDGVKRAGFQEFKEAAKLNKESAVSGNDKKKEIAREIRKMGVRVSKE